MLVAESEIGEDFEQWGLRKQDVDRHANSRFFSALERVRVRCKDSRTLDHRLSLAEQGSSFCRQFGWTASPLQESEAALLLQFRQRIAHRRDRALHLACGLR